MGTIKEFGDAEIFKLAGRLSLENYAVCLRDLQVRPRKHRDQLPTYFYATKTLALFVFAVLLCFCSKSLPAQDTDSTKARVYKIAILAPLYLDSVFEDNLLRDVKSIPRFMLPAFEFVQGAQIALDSLSLANEHIEAFIYDTKSTTEPLTELIKNKKLDGINLIIGSVKDNDFRQLADFSLGRNIPFISATFPNDGGVSRNPFLIIMNSTLRAHCEGIYGYILQNHGTDKIYLFKKPGPQEDKIASYFKVLNEQEGKPLLNIQTITFDSGFSAFSFKKKLDSNRRSIVIGGSLDEVFAKNLADVCYAAKKSYPLTLIGMPNWGGFKFFAKADSYKDFPFYFTSPYYNSKNNSLGIMLEEEYNRRFKAKPGDVVGKGFESVYYFTKLLTRYPNDLISHLNDDSLKVFSDYNFRPVPSKYGTIPDYYENKHLYIVRMLNATVSREF